MTTKLQQFADSFETSTRDNGAVYVCLKDDAPEWAQGVVQEAHAHMMPDDYRYKMISEVADCLTGYDDVDCDTIHEVSDGLVDVYTSSLHDWLASHNSRASYIDDARDEGLIPEGADLDQQLMIGQFEEYEEIAYSIAESLELLA